MHRKLERHLMACIRFAKGIAEFVVWGWCSCVHQLRSGKVTVYACEGADARPSACDEHSHVQPCHDVSCVDVHQSAACSCKCCVERVEPCAVLMHMRFALICLDLQIPALLWLCVFASCAAYYKAVCGHSDVGLTVSFNLEKRAARGVLCRHVPKWEVHCWCFVLRVFAFVLARRM